MSDNGDEIDETTDDETIDEENLDEPVLDGADEHADKDVDPRKGMSDPALIRDVESGKKTVNPYG
ncbi:MAG: hypothetical protein ACNYNX_03175 [Leucobacter sp.]